MISIILASAALAGMVSCVPEFGLTGDLVQAVSDGHPIIESGNGLLHFDWNGRATSVMRAGTYRVCSARQRVLDDLTLAELRPAIEAHLGCPAHILSAVAAEGVPAGWRHVAVITLSSRSTRSLQTCLFDLTSHELLAEFDLDEMYSTLYGTPAGSLDLATMKLASIGPGGDLGLAVDFLSSDGLVHEVGIWTDDRWIPLALPAVRGDPWDMVMGPNGEAVLLVNVGGPDQLLFFDASGALVETVMISPQQLGTRASKARSLTTRALVTTLSLAILTIAVLGLIWWFGPLNRGRHRA